MRHAYVVLPLLSFGAGAADAFAFTALGGIFTANMTGNAVLASMFTRSGYATTLAGAATALGAFVLALAAGFRVTRAVSSNKRTFRALLMSAACLTFMVLLWWLLPHTGTWLLCMVAGSAASMALQTVAAKRDRVPRGATTTYLTGTLTDLVQDISDGRTPLFTYRWYPLLALPLGAASATLVGMVAPLWTPLLPLATTLLCAALIAAQLDSNARQDHSSLLPRS
jgi:uncharacterized membrane protein YoaK (UPF0700 family)